ncbi:hypothetical protein TNCV_1895321 [Trichonephila clavipes]|nr:hypothetical protein TNCV_1895321 [Trichonephila clavipes]
MNGFSIRRSVFTLGTDRVTLNIVQETPDLAPNIISITPNQQEDIDNVQVTCRGGMLHVSRIKRRFVDWENCPLCVALFSYKRSFSDVPRRSEQWSSDADDTSAGTPLLTITPHQLDDVRALDRLNAHCSPTRRVFSSAGLDLMTSHFHTFRKQRSESLSSFPPWCRSTMKAAMLNGLLHTNDCQRRRSTRCTEVLPTTPHSAFDTSAVAKP